ncbi:phage tail tape measure protein [Spirosoma spitsbergense]|uniref:phage tail tape measure protein n=1 Tax=Spirosoma spitsbergense TaxID=431554 RepID=UPI000380F67A|nr:phage tail tape measure protein [Spirosoma spitsbergense]
MNTETPTIETEEIAHNAVVMAGPANTPIKFDVAKADIEQMKTHAAALTIAGPDDKAGFDRVYQLRQVVKKQRISVEKKAKELKAPHIQYNREVDSAMKELTDPMTGIEDGLSRKETAYIVERERLARERMLFLQQRTEGRVNQLRAYGFEWNATQETYDFDRKEELGYLMEINFDDIKGFSDEEYEPICERAYSAHEQEVKRIAEQVEAKRLEAKRIADEQQAEANRLTAQRLEQVAAQKLIDDQAAELKRQQDQVEADRKALQDQKDEALLKTRTAKLLEYGFVEVDGSFERPNVSIRPLYLLQYTEEQFTDILRETVEYFQKIEADSLQAIQDNAENLRLRTLAEKERRKADKERTARLKPEKKDFNQYLRDYSYHNRVGYEQPEVIELINRFNSEVLAVVETFRAQLDAL